MEIFWWLFSVILLPRMGQTSPYQMPSIPNSLAVDVAGLVEPQQNQQPNTAAENTPMPSPPKTGLKPQPSSAPTISIQENTQGEPAQEDDSAGWHPVVKVVDGDTFSVMKDGKTITVRLIGIDTPETKDPRKVVQCFGEEASAKAHELLGGVSVHLVADASQDIYDKYGRLLAYAYLPDGTFFNKWMIENGYAHEYTYIIPYEHQVEFIQAENTARRMERGLWSPETCAGNTTGQATTVTDQTAQPTDAKAAPSPITNPTCSGNVYNCTDFPSHTVAQQVFDVCYPTAGDIHKLDADGDTNACESLP